MYPNQIKNYTTIKEFDDHWKMLQDLRDYYTDRMPKNSSSLASIKKEEAVLMEYYQQLITSNCKQAASYAVS